MVLMAYQRFFSSDERWTSHRCRQGIDSSVLEGVHRVEQQDETTPFQLLLTIPQVAKALNLGRTKVYELIWKEHLPVQKFGRAIRVSKEDLQHWLEERNKSF